MKGRTVKHYTVKTAPQAHEHAEMDAMNPVFGWGRQARHTRLAKVHSVPQQIQPGDNFHDYSTQIPDGRR